MKKRYGCGKIILSLVDPFGATIYIVTELNLQEARRLAYIY